MDLNKIVNFLNSFLDVNLIEDKYCRNGLQVSGGSEVNKIAFAVDASLDVFKIAKKQGCDMVVVHHGIFWGSVDLVGYDYELVKFLIKNNMSLYNVHIPLDVNENIGNNVELAKIIGLKNISRDYSTSYAFSGVTDLNSLDIKNILDEKLNINSRLINFSLNNDDVSSSVSEKDKNKVLICSGSGSSELRKYLSNVGKMFLKNDIKLFITGEPSHEIYNLAKFYGVNLLFLGHYASETVGIRALMDVVKREFELNVSFIDVPTGL